LEGLGIRNFLKYLNSLWLAFPQGQTGGGSSLPRLEGKKVKHLLEVIQRRFYRKIGFKKISKGSLCVKTKSTAKGSVKRGSAPRLSFNLSPKEIYEAVKPPKKVISCIKRLNSREKEFLIPILRRYLEYLATKQFKRVQIILKEWDYESLKYFVPSITKKEFVIFSGYLGALYRYAEVHYEQVKETLRKLKEDPLSKLPQKVVAKESLEEFLLKVRSKEIKPEGYKNLGYRVALFLDEQFKVKDARIFATKDTLQKFRRRAIKQKLYILVQPNPVKITKDFWEEYRKNRKPEERVKLIQKYGLLKDEKAFYGELVWDLDSPYEEVEKAVRDFLRDIGVKEKPFLVQLEKTASGRGRLRIPLEISLNAQKKHGNGHTHLENIKEALSIVAVYFQQKGINVDLTFIDRPNHQIWDKVAHPKEGVYKIEKVVPTSTQIKFYDLYNRLKKLQREKELYYLKRGNKEVNLTTYFGWRPEYKKTKKTKVLRVPKFIAERLKDRTIENLRSDVKLYYWKQAVKSLAESVNDHRYNRVIRPAIGWAKYLDLDRYEVENYLKDLLSDRDTKKNDHDIEVAYREAPELEFKLPKGIRTLNFEALVKETLKVLAKEEEIPRQELIKLLGHQKWLVDLLMGTFEKVGLVSHRFVKAGRGRPKKVFALTEKGRLIAGNITEKVLNELWREAIAVGQDFGVDNNHQVKNADFSQYKNSPSLKVGVGIPLASREVFKGHLINLTKRWLTATHRRGEVAQMRFVHERKAPEPEGKVPPLEGQKERDPKGKGTKKVEQVLEKLRKGKPKRGGTSSLGEILGFD